MNIRTTCLALIVGTSFTLAGCDRVPGLSKDESSSAQSRLALSIDGTAKGEITSGSPVNYNDGSRHQLYTIELDIDQAIELRLAGALNGIISVYNGRNLIASVGTQSLMDEHDHGTSTDNLPLSLALRAPEKGTYTVAVSSRAANAYGPFELSSRAIQPYAGGPITVGSDAIDWLVGAKQDYTLTIDKAGLYDLTLESAAFDTVLKLTGKGVDQENDDYGNGTHSRLQLYLEAGQYTAQVRALDDTRRGAFKLALARSTLPEGTVAQDGTTLPHGSQISALMDSSARRSFNLVVGKHSKVVLDARSDDFDTVMEVNGHGVNTEDDDGGNGTNSHLDLNLSPGTYNVSIRSLGGNPGNFTLQASVSDL